MFIQGNLSRSTFPPVMIRPTRLPLKASGFLRTVANGTAEEGFHDHAKMLPGQLHRIDNLML